MTIQWHERKVNLTDLKPYEKNPRKISDGQYQKLKESLQQNGYHQRLIATPDMLIIGGHQRLKALAELGFTEINILVPDRALSDAEYKRMLVQDNLPFGEFDFDMLSTDFSFDELSEWGMTDDLLNKWKQPVEFLADPDAIPELPEVAVTQPGDIWLLGDHRLMCGDSTKTEDVAALLGKNKIDLAYCDPPYGIEVVRNHRLCGDKPFGKNGFDGIIKAGIYAPIIGDDTISTALASFAILNDLKIKTIILWGGNFYAHALPPAKCWIVWDKETDGNFGDGEIAYCTADKSIRIFRHKWSGMLKASERQERRVHPTQKPVALAEWAFDEFDAGQNVLDLFVGSGSTIIACENTGHTCFGMEMSPEYCDVIVKRFEDYTGKKAIHEKNRV